MSLPRHPLHLDITSKSKSESVFVSLQSQHSTSFLMIQRIQTIFMAITAIAMFSVLFLPIWSKTQPSTNETATLTAMNLTYTNGEQVSASSNTIYLAVLAFAATSVAIGSIASFRSRMKQMKLNFLNTVLMILTLGLSIYLILYQGIPMFEEKIQGRFGYGLYAIIIAMLSNTLANRFIMKDEKLVRSADRLR